MQINGKEIVFYKTMKEYVEDAGIDDYMPLAGDGITEIQPYDDERFRYWADGCADDVPGNIEKDGINYVRVNWKEKDVVSYVPQEDLFSRFYAIWFDGQLIGWPIETEEEALKIYNEAKNA